jgi:signal transduction histidine kinase
MKGTEPSQGAVESRSPLRPRWNARLAIFALALGLIVALIIWIQTSMARQMTQLEGQFGALKAKEFYAGVELRDQLRDLNDTLLDYEADHRPEARLQLLNQLETIRVSLDNRQRDFAAGGRHTISEQECFQKLRTEYEQLLDWARSRLRGELAPSEPRLFKDFYHTLGDHIRPVRDLIKGFTQAQQAAFDEFLQGSQRTLLSLQRLLTLSLLLLGGATVALAVLVYRGMIAPLRRELTESQALVERQEKLAALGTLAAGVAHEIRNPLTAIKFRLFSLKKALPDEFANHEDTGVITAELNRLERIVKDFLQFARPSEPELVRLPAQRLLEDVGKLFSEHLEKTGIVLRLEPSALVWIHADTQQLKQVLINLIQNAADSIGRNGTITLAVRSDVAALGQAARPVAILSVADTGTGIPPEVEKRLFDPFFTTRDGGTGLGLPIAARIVTNHGGLLRYRTQLHRGTTFEIVLPRIDDHAGPTLDH